VAKHFAAAFGEIVAILMRAPEYKNFPIADLEWLVIPAITTRQFFVSTAQSKTSGLTAPVGAVLWASVSPEIDRRLSASASLPVKLAVNEWKSGDILWVVAAVGDQRVLHGMLGHLQQKDWSGKPVKILGKGPDGVAVLRIKAD
jgi:hemolysin-activating ACP:hemolysin acyltransferase